jgi:putative spermidine/putrescine transport system substrate-binding protein
MRRWFLLITLLLILLAGGAFWWWSRPLPVLNVVTWSGTYGRAQAAAQMQAYGAEKHVDVRIQQWADNGTLDELRRAMTAHRADVVDLEMPVAVAACRAGLLEPIDAAALPPGDDGTPEVRDFYKGLVGPCFVASAVYSQMIVCQPCQPGTDLPGLFDRVAKGEKIALQRAAKVNLEMALLADGVKPEDVYATLATEAGAARAFARLDAIRTNIVWWTGADEPVTLLKRGAVRIATALTADVEATARQMKLPLLAPQFYEADVLAIPKGGAGTARALDYLHYATGSAPLANMVKFAPYMPPRRSSRALVAKLPPGPARDFVAGQDDALDHAFAIDDTFWAEHGAALEARFRAWADRP